MSIAYSLQRPALMLFYVTAIVLLMETVSGRRVLQGLAPMGRMPLTNYLMQSVICTTIFNGYGFGLFDRIGPPIGFGLAVVIYAAQLVWSRLWFRRFDYGPMEWLWRLFT